MKLTKAYAFSIVFLLTSSTVLATQAQPVPIPEDSSTAPQIEISAVGIGTTYYGKNIEHPAGEFGVDFSDSAIIVGAAQRLFAGGIGSLALGGVTTDTSVIGKGNSLFLHQAFLDLQLQSFEVLFGRSDNPTAHLVDFPTLREDDLIVLTNPLNPFSNGENLEEHRYSNVASFTLNQNLTWFENFHVQHLINSNSLGSETGINSLGITFQYLGLPGMEAFERIPSWGIGYEFLPKAEQSSKNLHQIYFGGVINLSESVVNRIDIRLQNILNLGSALRTLSNAAETFQADSNTTTFSLRYLNSPFGKAGFQLAFTGALKTYLHMTNANSYGGIFTAIKRLGAGFDLALQYEGQWRAIQLANAETNGLAFEQKVELGLVFNFDTVFNQHISPRRTLLNMQHQYIPD